VSSWIDQRTHHHKLRCRTDIDVRHRTVNVDAVLFWMVHDAQKLRRRGAGLHQGREWAAQTALRDISVARHSPISCAGREQIEAELQALIDSRSNPVGSSPCHSVEMRDVVIPVALQDASVARGAGRA
jgi:regulator of protease activity HflC (stomatin/prohibitin superfamily)